MTPQIKLVLVGALAFAIAKLVYKKDALTAGFIATSTISVIGILTAHKDEE
jgi:uncharacterized membrane protein YeaQ/YmgE (transglycosylase-associated protein family)